MYEIRPESIKTFITANNIQLPRFQRKQTWDAKKNFELCISVFKNYPIGVSILSVDTNRNKPVRWLLDGRQRRNALKQLFEDPENVYFWAQKFVKFKNNDQPQELMDKYWEKIDEFLEKEDEPTETESSEALQEDDIQDNDENLPDEVDTTEDSTNADLRDGLNLLFEIIRLCHNKTQKGTGFTAPFDFSKCVNARLPYYITQNGKNLLSSKRLKTFLNMYTTFCNEEGIEWNQEQSFLTFLVDQFSIERNSALDNHVHLKWSMMVERMEILQRIDDLLSTQTIGLIEVKNLKAADSQKIFNLINSKGSPLKPVEILSARPKWNIVIESPSGEVKDLVTRLYKEQMDILPEGVVRWDLAATFLRRLTDNFIFKNFSTGTTDFEKELTTAFKCLSGIFVEGVTKNDIDKLGDCNINWETDIDNLVNDIKNIQRLLETFSYFQFFKSWNVNIQEITSDGVAYEFLILIYKEWVKNGRPIGTSTETKKFQKYCFILWDRLVFEYINLLWKGSSDSKIRNDIQSTDPITPIPESQWEKLLEEISETNKIGERAVSYAYMQPLLYHFYCLQELAAPASSSYKYDIDHIIPQTLFKSSQIADKELIQDNLFNLALLPKRENQSKGGKKLSAIDDAWLKLQIKEYEFIPEDKYTEFSDVTNYKAMFEYRKPKFVEAFTTKRTYILNN